jgi:hypothetical protein
MFAANKGHTAMATVLIAGGADVDLQNQVRHLLSLKPILH